MQLLLHRQVQAQQRKPEHQRRRVSLLFDGVLALVATTRPASRLLARVRSGLWAALKVVIALVRRASR